MREIFWNNSQSASITKYGYLRYILIYFVQLQTTISINIVMLVMILY